MGNIRSSIRIVQKLRRKTAQSVIYPVAGSQDQHTSVLDPVHDRSRLGPGKIAEPVVIDHQHIKKA